MTHKLLRYGRLSNYEQDLDKDRLCKVTVFRDPYNGEYWLEVYRIFDRNRNNFSSALPYIKYFIIIALACTIAILFGTINIITVGEVSFNEKLLTTFNFVFASIIIAFCFIVIKEFKLIKRDILKINRAKDYDETDIIFGVNNKFKFIVESELRISKNLKENYAIVHYNINKFTIINNSVGYKVGDEVIYEIGKVLKRNLKNELIGKAEGDNYFALFKYDNQNKLIERALVISDKIEGLNIWNKINIKPAIKTGIFFVDKNNLDIRTAIDKAYIAKSLLNNSYISEYAVYNEKIGNNLIEIKRIEDDMHKALSQKEFKVYLQPKVDLKTGTLSGAEALVRWEHPKLGLLSPDKFIPTFEKNGFITKLDKYVFEVVCQNIKRWYKLGYDVVPISVNVSRIHFLNSNFVSDYNKIKEKYKIPDNLVEIEITESAVFRNGSEKEIFNVMNKFRDGGFEISMDDFGSGYSSLGLLKEMPIDTLKLDKLFLNNIEDYSSQIIVSNIVNMAKNLNLNVVCEGVETDMQVDFLRDIGCDMAQGYVFSKPEPIEKYKYFLNTFNTIEQYKEVTV